LCHAVLLLLVIMVLPPAGQVNSLTSFETDLPYEYYSMPFCKPPEGVHREGNAANLGTVIMGIKLLNSQYNFTIMVRTTHAAAIAAEPHVA
jgi:transmembrane 9 superfamily protein 2/4